MIALDTFTNPKITDKPMILEIFTNHEDENEALRLMTSIRVDAKAVMKNKVTGAIRSVAGEAGIKMIKGILKK